MNKVAFLGLGAMGERMARNLLRAGYELAVFNRTHEKAISFVRDGGIACLTPREAVAQADVVISVVANDGASNELWTNEASGALGGIKNGAICVEMSTLSPGWVRELGILVETRGGKFIEAPVVGSRPQAEAGQLIVLAGGMQEQIKQVEHVFAAMAAKTHHIGELGKGAIAKLAVNFLFATQVAAVAELLVLTQKNGLKYEAMGELLASLPVASPAALGALKLMMSEKYSPMFPIDLVTKDLGYFRGLVNGSPMSTPVADAVHRLYRELVHKGHGGDNIHGVIQAYA